MTVFKMDSNSHPYIYYTYKYFMYLGIAMIACSILSIINSF